jgi:hypothetical protein
MQKGAEDKHPTTHLSTGAACAHDLDPNILKSYEIIRTIGSQFFRER